MIIEGLRTDSLYLGPLRVSQWLSGALVLICGVLLIFFFTRLKNAKEALTYESMFDDIDAATVKTVSYYEGDESDQELSDNENTTPENNADETNSETSTSEKTASIDDKKEEI